MVVFVREIAWYNVRLRLLSIKLSQDAIIRQAKRSLHPIGTRKLVRVPPSGEEVICVTALSELARS